MGWLREFYEKAKDILKDLSHDIKSVKIIIYFITVALIFTIISILFTFAYTGSCCPFNLLGYENISYSYAGSPNFAHIYANDYDIGINGANNSMANLTIYGESDITLYSKNAVDTTSYDGKVERINNNNKYRIHTFPGDVTSVYIDKRHDEKFNYNMRFQYYVPKAGIIANGSDQKDCFKLIKKGDEYTIKSTFQRPAPKKFWVKNYGNNTYPIYIHIKNNTTSNTGSELNNVWKLNYTGRVRINTNSDLEMDIPASEISQLAKESINKVEILNSEGRLDVRHTEYQCSHADNINLTSAHNNTIFKLLNGKISISGNAKLLEFRDRYFHQPLTVILKEGNFAIITGLLMALFTFFLTRLYAQFKK